MVPKTIAKNPLPHYPETTYDESVLRLDRALTNQKELLVKTIEAHMRGDIE